MIIIVKITMDSVTQQDTIACYTISNHILYSLNVAFSLIGLTVGWPEDKRGSCVTRYRNSHTLKLL